VITGAGIITALGQGWNANAAGFRLGTVAFSPVTLFDVSRQRARTAAQIELGPMEPGLLTRRRVARLDRAGRFLLLAGREAVASAGLNPRSLGGPLPVVVASTCAGMCNGEEYLQSALAAPARRRGQPTRMEEHFVSRHLRDLAIDLAIAGPSIAIADACAAGANAIGCAWELLRAGKSRCALAGGYDALSQLVFAGFDSLQALSTSVCRPFDRTRDGLGLGEGAAMLVLETLDHARRRGARILAEVAGFGTSTDLHHLTQPHPEGRAAIASMTSACAAAGVSPGSVGYINAHGTGTPLNDAAESAAIRTWAGPAAKHIPVSSTKSAIGHLLGAAGAVEAVVCVMALREQWYPPTTPTREPDPTCDLRLITRPQDADGLEIALSNSFGFGGSNATLVFKRWPELA
jgi:3-oxoacyl-[acyl-carrier-protein] synthase II